MVFDVIPGLFYFIMMVMTLEALQRLAAKPSSPRPLGIQQYEIGVNHGFGGAVLYHWILQGIWGRRHSDYAPHDGPGTSRAFA